MTQTRSLLCMLTLAACAREPSPNGPLVATAVGMASTPPLRLMPVGVRQAIETPVDSAVPITLATSFTGLGIGLGSYTAAFTPPDTVGAVGPNHYVQAVNASVAIFDKGGMGNLLAGPFDLRLMFGGLGGPCAASFDGAPTVLYDRLANRWVITELANPGGANAYNCVAVSQSADPTGAWWVYSFSHAGFLEGPRLSLWPDGYYLTENRYSSAVNVYFGARVCVLDRSRMLAGLMPTIQCFDTTPSFAGLQVADHDGPTTPPVGSPAYVLGLGDTPNSLALWRLHVDWVTPSQSTLTGPEALAVGPFTEACRAVGGECITQPATSNLLSANGARLAGRVVYRNRVTHEAVLAAHTITADISTGVRWYELRSPRTTPVVYQEGTIAPDSAYRWNPSLAMDLSGDVAFNYNASSAALGVYPSIRVSGQLVSDPLNTTPQGEAEAFTGTGVIIGSLHKWGSSAMNVDPVDHCTFWYTNQYIAVPHTYNWSTRIGSFRFPSCVSADFALVPNPARLAMDAGVTLTSAIASTQLGDPGGIALNAEVSPPGQGVTATLNPSRGDAGMTATLSVTTSASAVGGAYTVTVTGTEGTATHQTTVGVSVSQADFTLSAAPTMLTVAQGMSGTSALTTTRINGPGSIVFAAAVSPSGRGVTAVVAPGSVVAGAGGTLTVLASASAFPGAYTVTVTGNEGAAVHTATVNVTVPAPPDFTMTALPDAYTIIVGRQATGAITTTQVGPGGTLSVSVYVSPPGAGLNASLNLATMPTGGNATLTLTALAVTQPGVYSVIVTGTEGAIVRSVLIPVTVQAESDFAITATPASISMMPGMFATSDITTRQINSAGTIALTALVSPEGQGVTASIDKTSVAAGGGAVVTVVTSDTAVSGRYTVSVKGVEGPATHIAPIIVAMILPADFTMGAAPAVLDLNQGERATSTISTTQVGLTGTVALSVFVTPALQGVTATIVPNQSPVGNKSSLAITATQGAAPGPYIVTVTGAEGPAKHEVKVAVNVIEVPADFSISAAPTTLIMPAGGAKSAVVSTARSGNPGSVALVVNVAPFGRGVTASVSPASVESGGNSTLSVVAADDATGGSYNITVVGTEGSFKREVTVQATVQVKQPPAPPPGCLCGVPNASGFQPLVFGLLVLLSRRRRA